jgi:uncharacterized protein
VPAGRVRQQGGGDVYATPNGVGSLERPGAQGRIRILPGGRSRAPHKRSAIQCGVSRDAAAVLREARARSGLSQAELARRAGVAQPVISAYETGRREPSVSMLTKLVAASGHDLSIGLAPRAHSPRELPDSPMGRHLRRRRRAILAAAERRGASNVRIFGSVARGEDGDRSDVDVLVDLADDVGLVGLIGLERELSEILRRDVDVVPARGLKPAIAERVLAEAVLL